MLHKDFDSYLQFAAMKSQRGGPNVVPDQKPSERRGRPRHAFWAIQRIAPRIGSGVPAESEFFEVRCFDLSMTGFSFLLSSPPPFEAVVVALAEDSKVTYLTGKIVHCRKVMVCPSGHVRPITEADSPERIRSAQGIPMVLVGVRFTERLPGPPEA